MDLKDLLLKTRSYRRFYQNEKIPTKQLKNTIAALRFAPSPANIQPLKFIIINQEKTNAEVFEHLNWAAYLKDWSGPSEGERPSAYIIMLGEKELSPYIFWDYGIALQTILLSLTEKGYGACAIASFSKKEIRKIFDIEKKYEIPLVIAVGKPKETVVIDDVKDGNIQYWRDENEIHHVPKKHLQDLIDRIIE